MQPSTIHPLQEALEALEDAQQSADAASSIHDRVARQAKVLEQLQSQLEEAQHQQVGFCGIFPSRFEFLQQQQVSRCASAAMQSQLEGGAAAAGAHT